MSTDWKSQRPILITAAVLLLLSLTPRFWAILKFLPAYAMDENEVVESAVGFLGGDLDPRMYRYGPLHAYLLAVIYWCQAFLSGLDPARFARGVFFDATGFYYTARFFSACLSLLLTFLTYRIARRCYGERVAAFALLLAAFPFFDLLVNFKVRVDTLLAVCAMLTVVSALEIADNGRQKHYLLAGLFFGMGIASKPLPGLLIGPTILLAHVIAVRKRCRSDGLLSLATAFRDGRLFLFALCGLASTFLFHPYAFLRFDHFTTVQRGMIRNDGAREFLPGWEVSKFFKHLGVGFVILAVVALVYALYRALRARSGTQLVLLSYPVVFWLAFAPGAARRYFYVPMLPILIIAIARLVADASDRFGRRSRWAGLVTAALLLGLAVAQPAWRLASLSLRMNQHSGNPDTLHTARAGTAWIEQNLPRDARILLLGFYTDLPRLVDPRSSEQAAYGEYFMYDRHENAFLRAQFEVAHAAYVQAGRPTFDLEAMRRFDAGRLDDSQQTLSAYCRARGLDYVISSFDLSGRPGFEDAVVRSFDRAEYPFGRPFTIYRPTPSTE